MVSRDLLHKYANAFVMYEIANHGVNPREKLNGTTFRIEGCEGYKYTVAYNWKQLTERVLDTNDVIEHADCLTLVFAWLYYMKANHWKRDATQVKPFYRLARKLKQSDMSRYWLFCYEVLQEGTLAGEWKAMKQAGVSFIKPEFLEKKM